MGLDGAINTIARVASPPLLGYIHRRRGPATCFGAAGCAVVGAAIVVFRDGEKAPVANMKRFPGNRANCWNLLNGLRKRKPNMRITSALPRWYSSERNCVVRGGRYLTYHGRRRDINADRFVGLLDSAHQQGGVGGNGALDRQRRERDNCKE